MEILRQTSHSEGWVPDVQLIFVLEMKHADMFRLA